MYKFSKYKGKVFKKLPIDIGRRILKLNWVMSSSMLDEYIYENDKGQLFYVHGVWQAANYGDLAPGFKSEDSYHMALAIPVKSYVLLSKYLNGDIEFKKALHKSSYSYVLILKPQIYFKDGRSHASMHEVKDGKEVSRIKECELNEFEFVLGKKCFTKTLPYMYNPKNACMYYKLREKLNFIFIDKQERRDIFKFIKKYKK